MFTEQQLKAAHSKVKTGTDFPKYIQEIKGLGLIQYEFWVADGHITYFGEDHKIDSASKYGSLDIADQSNIPQLKHTIAIHQQGQTDFMTFCNQAAGAGVEKWVIDTQKMMCTYYNRSGNEMVAEPIPEQDYA